MKVREIRLCHFRNHRESELKLGPGMNVLLGDNGQGKTNVLEAISFLCLTKSFYADSDATVLQLGSGFFEVEGELIADAGSTHTVRVVYVQDPAEKQVTINGVRPDTLSSVIGRFPVVVLSPEKNAITFGGPTERRKFLDLLLSQMSAAYFEDLLEFRRILKQRNRLLLDLKLGRDLSPATLEPWSVSLAQYGGRLIASRRSLIAEFDAYVKRAYADLVRNHESPALSYKTLPGLGPGDDVRTIAGAMMRGLEHAEQEERRRGTTLVGPHRDDIVFTIDGTSVQHYASQGQHKTLLVALKVAEFHYLAERRAETPVFLLDDVFSELDAHRSRHLLDVVDGLGQGIITTTDEAVFHGLVHWDGGNRRFTVEAGRVLAQHAL